MVPDSFENKTFKVRFVDYKQAKAGQTYYLSMHWMK